METIQILVRMTISFALVALLVAIASAQDAASKSDDAKPTEPSAIKNDFSVKEDDGPTESNITMPDITGTWACAEIKRANGFGGTEVPHNGETFKIRKANGTSGEFEVYDYNPMPDEDVLVLHRLKWTPKTRKFRESIVVDDGPPKEKIEHLVIVNEAGKRLAINSVFKTENGDIQNAYDSVWIRQSETVPTVPLNDLIKRMPFAPPDSENATSKSLDKNPVDSGDLDVKRNLAAKFLRTEVDFLIKQLEETSNRNQQRETFLQEMRLLDPLYVGAPVSEIVTFATSIVKRLGKQLDIEIGSKPEEIRLDWLKLIVISDSAILRDLHSAQMIEGAIDRIQEFAEQMKLIGSELKDPSIENELVSNVAYYQLGCRIGQSSGLSFQWNGETIRLIAEFLDHYPNSTGAARVAYEAGRYLEFASRKKTQIIEEVDVN